MKKLFLLTIFLRAITNNSTAQTQGTPESGYSRCLIYSATAADQTFTVPVTSVYYVKLWGAGGGGNNWNPSAQYGGAGGFARGSVTLTKNTAVTLIVGKGGINADGNYTGAAASGVATYGGGGAGGVTRISVGGSGYGASGGGRSALRYDVNGNTVINLPTEEIITAGGGGGASAGTTGQTQQAGVGGGLIGTAGSITGLPAASNGGGGTQVAGGAAGTAGGSFNGVAGSQFTGGRAGITAPLANADGGGGGGGGWFGGGGGTTRNGAGDAPGGAGSSHFAAPITGGLITAGSTINAGNNGDVHYGAGVGAGGVTGNGGDGRIVIQWNEDHSDAPASFGDPGHGIPGTPTIYLGTTIPDGDTYANVSTFAGETTATGDESTSSSDEDGISSAINIPRSATSYSQTITVRNTSGSNATLSGWVDFDKNGSFSAGELAQATVANGATSATLTWVGLSGLTFGSSYARFRISSNAADVATPASSAIDGEVEDYPVTFMSPLPVTLVKFTTELFNCETHIKWTTASEINSNLTEIERSNNGVEFTKIATFNSDGNSTSLKNYSYIDYSPELGKNYYRLKMLDNNGSYVYSSLLKADNICEKPDPFLIYPNPFDNYLKIVFLEPGQNAVKIELADLVGKIILKHSVNATPETQTKILIDTTPLHKGIYTIKITDASNKIIGKIQKIIKK